MGELITNIISIATLVGLAFMAFFTLKKPQEKLEINQSLTSADITSKASALQEEVKNRAVLLANQLEWEKTSTKEKFIEQDRKLNDALVHMQKEMVKIEMRLEGFIVTQMLRNEEYGNHFTKLFTLLEERLPKKTK